MSDDPFGSLDPSSSGGPIEEPRMGFLSRLFRRRRQNPSQLPEGEMLDFESGPPEGHQTPTSTPTPTPTPTPSTPTTHTPSPTPPARLGSAGQTTPGQTRLPQWPQPIKPSGGGGFPVGMVVVILIIVAVFGVGIVSCVAALDEGFDTADEVFDDFSNDFSNDFSTNVPNPNPDLEAGPPVAPDEYIPEFGTDEDFDRLANDCFGGDMRSCDQLYAQTPISEGESYEGYGERCGGRVDRDIWNQCAATFGEQLED